MAPRATPTRESTRLVAGGQHPHAHQQHGRHAGDDPRRSAERERDQGYGQRVEHRDRVGHLVVGEAAAPARHRTAAPTPRERLAAGPGTRGRPRRSGREARCEQSRLPWCDISVEVSRVLRPFVAAIRPGRECRPSVVQLRGHGDGVDQGAVAQHGDLHPLADRLLEEEALQGLRVTERRPGHGQDQVARAQAARRGRARPRPPRRRAGRCAGRCGRTTPAAAGPVK